MYGWAFEGKGFTAWGLGFGVGFKAYHGCPDYPTLLSTRVSVLKHRNFALKHPDSGDIV